MACHHCLKAAHTVERCRAWHAIVAFGLANSVRRHRAWHAIIACGQHRQSNSVLCGMPSSPFGSTHGRTASGVACHHRPWTIKTVGRHRAWHAIIALGQNTRSDGVGHGMSSSPLDNTHRRTTLGLACHHPPWAAQIFGRCQAWHAIIALG